MKDRKVIRIAVSKEAKDIITAWADQNDMTEIGIASRIYEWFGRQPEEIQRLILGLYGSKEPDVVQMILERRTKRRPRTRHASSGSEKMGS